jgi:hypothetical protein
MRSTAATIILVLSMAGAALGQTLDQREAQLHRGRRLFWTGAGLVGIGLFTLPWTAVADSTYNPAAVSGVFLAAGSTFMVIGMRVQQKATQPTLTLGVSIGRTSAVQFRRSW